MRENIFFSNLHYLTIFRTELTKIFLMSYFKPSPAVLEKWAYTRKSPKILGSSFTHPRLFSTVEIRSDRALFYVAILIEIVVGILAVAMRGFDGIVIAAATGLLCIDLILAYQLHARKENNKCKLNCKIEILKYRKQFNLFEISEDESHIKSFRDGIEHLEKRQKKYAYGIILSAIIKILGFWIINYFGIAIFAFVSVLYAFAAFIHIKHTGYYWFYSSFNLSYKKERGVHSRKVVDGKLDDTSKADTEPIDLKKVPKEIKELLEEKTKDILIDSDDKDVLLLFGKLNKTELKIVCKIKRDAQKAIIRFDYFIERFGLIEDEKLFHFINNAEMPESLKSFVGYFCLVQQSSELNRNDNA